MSRRSVLSLIALAALSPAAAGDLKVGDGAPEIEAEKLLNTEVKSLKELKGKLVLYEYFAWW